MPTQFDEFEAVEESTAPDWNEFEPAGEEIQVRVPPPSWMRPVPGMDTPLPMGVRPITAPTGERQFVLAPTPEERFVTDPTEAEAAASKKSLENEALRMKIANERAKLVGKQYLSPGEFATRQFGGIIPNLLGGLETAFGGAVKGIGVTGAAAPAPVIPDSGSQAAGFAAKLLFPEQVKTTPMPERTPGEVMRDIEASPIVKAGELLQRQGEEFWQGPEISRGAPLSRAARTAGELGFYAISPETAPFTIAMQTIGTDISSDFERAKEAGLNEEAAARRAIDSAMLKGGAQAAIFAILPPALRKAGDKYLLEKLGPEAVKQFIARRVAQVGEGAVLGAATGGVEGEPLAGATGMALLLGVMPRGLTARQAEERAVFGAPPRPDVEGVREFLKVGRQPVLRYPEGIGVQRIERPGAPIRQEGAFPTTEEVLKARIAEEAESPAGKAEAAKRKAINIFMGQLERIKQRPEVPRGPEEAPAAPGAVAPRELATWEDFVADFRERGSPDMTVRQIQDFYSEMFPRIEGAKERGNKEAAKQLARAAFGEAWGKPAETKPTAPEAPAEITFLGMPRSRWSVEAIAAFTPENRSAAIAQAIAALKAVGGKTKLKPNATDATLLKAINEVIDLREQAKPKAPPALPAPQIEPPTTTAPVPTPKVSAPTAPATPAERVIAPTPPEGMNALAWFEDLLTKQSPTTNQGHNVGFRLSTTKDLDRLVELYDIYNSRRKAALTAAEKLPFEERMKAVQQSMQDAYKPQIIREAIEAALKVGSAENIEQHPTTPRPFDWKKNPEGAAWIRNNLAKLKEMGTDVPEDLLKPAPDKPATPTPQKPAGKLPQIGEELVATPEPTPAARVDMQRGAIVRILENVETVDNLGRVRMRDIAEEEWPEISRKIADALGRDWGEIISMEDTAAVKLLRERLSIIEGAKKSGRFGDAAPPPIVTQAPNESLARLRWEYKQWQQDKRPGSEVDALESVETAISDFPQNIPEGLKTEAKKYRAALDEDVEPGSPQEKAFMAEFAKSVGETPEAVAPKPERPAAAVPELDIEAERPNKGWFPKFAELDEKVRAASRAAGEAQANYEKESRYIPKSRKAREARNARLSELSDARTEAEAAYQALQKEWRDLRMARQAEAYDYDTFISQGKELPADREANYTGEAPPKAEAPTPTPAPTAPTFKRPIKDMRGTFLGDFPVGTKVVRGDERYTIIKQRKGSTWVGTAGDPIGIQLGSDSSGWSKVETKPPVAATPEPVVWKGLTLSEIKRKLPIAFDPESVRIEGDRVIARQKPERGGVEYFVDVKKAEAEPVVTESPAPTPEPEPPAEPVAPGTTVLQPGPPGTRLAELIEKQNLFSAKVEAVKKQRDQIMEERQKLLRDPDNNRDKLDQTLEQVNKLQEEINKLNQELPGGEIAIERMRMESAAFRGKPKPPAERKITGKVLTAQKEDLLAKIDEAIKEAPDSGTDKITLSVKDDGDFTIINTKDTLKQFKGIVQKDFPTTVAGTGSPKKTKVSGRQITKVTEPKAEDLPEVAGAFTSADQTRYVLTRSYADGTQIVATDARHLIRIISNKAPGSPASPVRLTPEGKEVPAEGKYPNWQIVASENPELLVGGVDTGQLSHIINQGKVFRNVSISDKDKRAGAALELFINPDRSLGGRMKLVDGEFVHNVQDKALSLGSYNPDYLEDIFWAARKLGNERVDLYAHGGDTGPLGVNGKNFEALVMPIRPESQLGMRDHARAFSKVEGKAEHAKHARGYGPIESPDAEIINTATDGGRYLDYRVRSEGGKLSLLFNNKTKDYNGVESDYWIDLESMPVGDWPESTKAQNEAIAKLYGKHAPKSNLALVNKSIREAIEKTLAERNSIIREGERRRQDEGVMPMRPGPGAAAPAEFAQRAERAERMVAAAEPSGVPPAVMTIEGDQVPTPDVVRKNRDYNIFNRLNSGQWTFYFGRLGDAARAAWTRMALGEFQMREAIQRDVLEMVDGPLRKLPSELKRDGGKTFFEVLDGKTMDDVRREWEGRPNGDVVIAQAELIKTRLDDIRVTIRDLKRDAYNRYLKGMKRDPLAELYEKNIGGSAEGKTKETMADALTMDAIPDDWGIADGSYLPHMFFGQWKITAQAPGTENPTFIGRAKTPQEAKARIFEMTRSNPELRDANFTITQDTVVSADMIRLGDRKFWHLIQQMKDKAQGDVDPKEAIHGIIGRKAAKQKWFGNLKQRKGFLGYSQDYRQVMTTYLNAYHRWKELTQVNQHVQPLIEQVRREGRLNAEGRLNDILDTLWGKPAKLTMEFDAFLRNIPVVRDIVKPLALDRWARMINTTVTNLTLNTLRFQVVNRLQPLQGLYPIIGEKTLAEAKIMQHTPEGRKLLDKAGVIFDPGQFAGEYAAGGGFRKFRERLTGERSNQELAFLGMYLHARKLGMSGPSAINYGKLRGQLMTQFTPLIVDTPPLMEGPVGRVLFQFKRFPVKQIELLTRMAADRNLPALVRFFVVMGTIGGLSLAFRQSYLDREKRLRVKRGLDKAVGEKAADFIYYGLPGLVGGDLSGSLVLGDEPFGANVYEQFGRSLLGPAAGVAIETGKAIAAPQREPMTPTEKSLAVLRRIPSLRPITELNDLITSNVDVTTPDGETKYRRKIRDIILGLGSFRSANEANIQMAVSGIVELKKEIQGLKNDFYVASRSKDSQAVVKARQAVRDFNARWPEAAITASDLQSYVKYRIGGTRKTDVQRVSGKEFRKLMPPQ